jgi:nitroreductase
MARKSLVAVFLVLFSVTSVLKSQSGNNGVIDVIMSGYSAKMFTTKPVSDTETDQIVKCGMKAPSARNMQRWKFTVVKDTALMNALIPKITSGNILIVVSGPEPKVDNMLVDFDCALATENMYIAAQGLGLGAHIYASPVNNINTSMKEALSIPEGYKAVTVLRVGNIDKGVDAVSGASARKKLEEVVIYK